MAPQQPPPTAGTISPDGAYIWNGSQWVPNAPAAQAAVVKKKGHMGRNLGIGCLGLIVLLVIITVAASSGSKTSNSTSSGGGGGGGNQPAASCTPKPCADADSFTVSITGINRNLPPGDFNAPEAGNHFVAMQATLHNGSGDKKSANPFDFKLRDANGQEHDIAFNTDPACGVWQSVDLAQGASLGPKSLCFEASGAPEKPLTVIWSPGFFNSKVDIPLQ